MHSIYDQDSKSILQKECLVDICAATEFHGTVRGFWFPQIMLYSKKDLNL